MVIDRRRTNKKTMENRGFEPLTYRLRTYPVLFQKFSKNLTSLYIDYIYLSSQYPCVSVFSRIFSEDLVKVVKTEGEGGIQVFE